MSLGDTLSDLFSTSTSGIDRANRRLAAAYGPATSAAKSALQKGQQGVIGSFGKDYVNPATGAVTGGQQSAIDALLSGGLGGVSALGEGEAQALGLQGQGIAPYASLWNQYAPGADLYWSGLGAGGMDPTAAANAFKASPFGQQLQSDLATAGEAGARGMGATGQTGQGLLDLARTQQGLTSQAEQGWLQDLFPAISGQQTAAGGLQRGYQAAAGVPGQFAPEIADIYTGLGSQLGGVYTGTGQSLADIFGVSAAGKAGGYSQFAPALANLAWQGKLGGPMTLAQGAAQDYAGSQAGATTGMNFIDALISGGSKVASAGLGATSV